MSLTGKSSTVSVDEVRHIAELSNLRLTLDEERSMERDLNAILSYVAELSELDTTDVAPMAQVSEMLLPASSPASAQHHDALETQDSRTMLRPDERRPSLDRELVMTSAPETDGAFFKVPKVIER